MTQAEIVRKTLIGMALRRQRPGSGSTLQFLRERTARVQWPDIGSILEDVPAAVIGAVATRHYMPERVTQDMEVVVAVPDTSAAHAKLQAAGWILRGNLSIGGTGWESPEGIRMDLVEGREPWWPAAIAEAQSNRDIQGLPILPLPYLVLMKFRSGRTQDVADITRMLGQAGDVQIGATQKLFRAEEPQGLEELESLVYLGRLEMVGEE